MVQRLLCKLALVGLGALALPACAAGEHTFAYPYVPPGMGVGSGNPCGPPVREVPVRPAVATRPRVDRVPIHREVIAAHAVRPPVVVRAR